MKRLLLGFAVLAALVAPAAAQGWKPTRNVEIIAAATPGGGFDTQSRLTQKILQESKIVDVPMTVTNKPGAGGSIGWASLNTSDAGHTIAAASTTLLTNDILGVHPLKYTDLKLIAIMASEYLVFSVKADSKFKTPQDLMEALKKDPTSVKFATSPGPGNGNHILMGMLAKSIGVDVKKLAIVYFQSVGEVSTALLGGHIDISVGTLAPIIQFIDNKTIRVLAVGSPERLSGSLASVPTWREVGVDAVFQNWRGVVGSKSMTAEQLAYWEQALQKAAATKEWADSVEKSFQVNEFKTGKAAQDLLDGQYKSVRAVMVDLGLVK